MKTIEKTNIDSLIQLPKRKYSSIDEFISSKVKEASDNLKKVDLSILKR